MKFSRLIQLFLTAVLANTAAGQEMEPRAYSPAPSGTQFVLLSYGHQSGDVLLDASLPLKDVSIKLNAVSFGYGRTFNFVGRQANVAVLLPYIWGTAQGTVFEDQINVRRSGGGDLRVRFSTLLKGGEALAPKEFAQRKPATIIGASVSIVIPTGQYDPARLVNPGSNRWAFKPEIGVSKPSGRWTFEVMGGTWLFTANNSFLGNSRRAQKPMASFQGAVIYTLRPRMWVSANATFYRGGSTVLNDSANEDRQRNARIGATFSFPLNQQQSLKIAWAKGVTT
ncbi:MAG TPA: transporter, partial [Pyrinomonadaceae bacterium]|nr:transporter [Pyrinomonadaceae bacterium]